MCSGVPLLRSWMKSLQGNRRSFGLEPHRVMAKHSSRIEVRGCLGVRHGFRLVPGTGLLPLRRRHAPSIKNDFTNALSRGLEIRGAHDMMMTWICDTSFTTISMGLQTYEAERCAGDFWP